MSANRDREEGIFDAARELASNERAAYLAETCGQDADLRQRIEGMLEADAAAGEFFKTHDVPSPTVILADASLSPSIEKPGDRIGRYKVLQQIGEGGMGSVYMAEQDQPVRRSVALKIIKLGMDTRQVVARFEAERQALAMMNHPHIAKVFDAGATDSGRPYFVMELVRGIPITEYCDKNCLPTRQRLDLFILVCQAVQHAHQKGVIHRDLKPSNILVTLNDGVPWPMIIDFGIAKATHQRLTEKTLFTNFAQMIGTPAYMSPEQAEMSKLDVDTRTDIYALGVLLYELLTGATPFPTKELLSLGYREMQRTIAEREPPRLSTRLSTMANEERTVVAKNRSVDGTALAKLFRGDLDWIAMKCLEKDRTRRYDTANGLASDIQRYLNSEPVVARPPSQVYRLQKFAHRNKLAFVAASAIAAVLVVGVVVSTFQAIRATRAEHEQSRLREDAQKAQAGEAQARRRIEAQELAARKKAYASDMKLLQVALAADDLGRAQELLNRQRPQPGEQDLRGWEWRYLWQFSHSDAAFTLCQMSNSILSVSFSSDSALLAVGTLYGGVTVWDLATRQMLTRYGKSIYMPKLAFAPSGDTLAFGDESNDQASIVLWNSRAGTEIRRLPVNALIRDLAFTRDGRLFAADTSFSNNITVWDIVKGNLLTNFTAIVAGTLNGTLFAVTGGGDRFAHEVGTPPAGSPSGFVQVVEANGKRGPSFQAADEVVTAMAFSPDGQTLVTGAGYSEGALKLWDVPTRRLVGSLEGHRRWAGCLKFLPDDKTLASASADRTIRLWNFETRQSIRALRGHAGEVWTIGVSPEGRWLASGGKDGSVTLWNLTSSTNRPPEYRTLPVSGVRRLGYSPDGRLLAATHEKRLKLFNATTLQLVSEPARTWTNITGFAFSPDMHLLLLTTARGRLGVWDMQEQRMLTNFVAHRQSAAGLEATFVSDGKSALTHGAGVFKEWDVATWQQIRRWPASPNLRFFWDSGPTTNLLATDLETDVIEVIPIHDPDNRRRFKGQTRISSVNLSPDGKTLAAASHRNEAVELWDTKTLTRRALLRGERSYHSVVISPDGQRLAAGAGGKEAIKIWDLDSHEEVATLAGQGSLFQDAVFSPDGNTIAALNWNGVLHLWTAPAWSEIEAAEARKKSAR